MKCWILILICTSLFALYTKKCVPCAFDQKLDYTVAFRMCEPALHANYDHDAKVIDLYMLALYAELDVYCRLRDRRLIQENSATFVKIVSSQKRPIMLRVTRMLSMSNYV